MNSSNYQIFETTVALPRVAWNLSYSSGEWQKALDFFIWEDDSPWRLEYKLDSLNWCKQQQQPFHAPFSQGQVQFSFQGQVSLRATARNRDKAKNDVSFRFFVGKGEMLKEDGTIQLTFDRQSKKLTATSPEISTQISLNSNGATIFQYLVIGIMCENPQVKYNQSSVLRSHVSEAFVDLLRCSNSNMGDAQFEVDGTIIGAQKAKLIEKSDYFKTMFSSGLREAQDAVTTAIVVPDVMCENFAKILAYIYSDQIEVPNFDSEKFRDLYAASVKYMLTDLTAILDKDIKQKITIHNVSSFLFEFAFLYEKNRQMLVSFIASRLSQVRQTADFKKVVEGKSELEEYGELMAEILMSVETSN